MALLFLPSIPAETTETVLFSSTPLQEESNGSSWFQTPCDTTSSMDVAPGPLPQLDLPELIEVLKQEETEDRGCSIVQSLHTNTTEVGFLRESPNFELEDGFGEEQSLNCPPLPNLDAFDHHKQTFLLPKSISDCSLDGEAFQRDVLLSNHPLVPHLQQLLLGKDHPLLSSPDLASSLKCGVLEADDTLLQAVAQAVELCGDPETQAQMKKLDQEHGSFVGDTKTFCQRLFSDLHMDPPSTQRIRQTRNDENVNSINTSQEKHIFENCHSTLGASNRTTLHNLSVKCKQEATPLKRKKRTFISRKNTEILKQWLFEHSNHPYPNDDEKDELCLRTNLTISQLNNWFINARRRILPAYLKNRAV